jgi:hypothetical protein
MMKADASSCTMETRNKTQIPGKIYNAFMYKNKNYTAARCMLARNFSALPIYQIAAHPSRMTKGIEQ